jgi:DNA-binding beta-propeller fold protein YncE
VLVLAVLGCAVPASADRRPTTAADASPPAFESVRPPPTATRDPARPAATPAPTVPSAYPTLDPSRPYVYVVDYYHGVAVVDPRVGAVVGQLPIGLTALPAFSPDGGRLYVTHRPRTAYPTRLDVFDVAGRRRLASAEGLEVMDYKIWGPPVLAPARDGRAVYVHGRRITSRPGEAGRDACWIYRFDVDTGQLAPETIPLPVCRVAPIALAADGRTLYLGGWLVDLTARPPALRDNHALADRAWAQSPDGRRIYALGRGGDVVVWDTDARRALRTLPGAAPAYGSGVYLTHAALHVTDDGTRLLVASDDGDPARGHAFGRVLVLDSATAQRLGEVRPETGFVEFAPSPDGRELCVLVADQGVPGQPATALEVWDVTAGTRRLRVRGMGASAGPVLAPPAALPTTRPGGGSKGG